MPKSPPQNKSEDCGENGVSVARTPKAAPALPKRVASEQFLPTAPPFDHLGLVEFLRTRIVVGVEQLETIATTNGGSTTRYIRTLTAPHGLATFAASFAPDGVRCDVLEADERDLAWVYSTVRRFFDLDAPAASIHDTFIDDPVLGPMAMRHPGLRLPNHPDGFEVSVRAIVGQQISVVAAQTVLARISAAVGTRVEKPGSSLLFPTAEQIAEADPAIFPFPRARAETLQRLARLVALGELSLDYERNPADLRADLLAIKGVGPWTADYICMRACRATDIFLSTDLVIKNALKAIDPVLPMSGWIERAGRWSPYGSYATLYLWRSTYTT